MLSQRVYTLLKLVNIFQLLGIISLSFDSKTFRFGNNFNSDSKSFQLLKVNYSLLMTWCVLGVNILIKHVFNGDLEQFYVGLIFWFAGSAFIAVFSINFWYADDVCQLGNFSLGFLRHLHGIDLRLYFTLF